MNDPTSRPHHDTDPRATLIESNPRAVRAPFTVPNHSLDHLQASDTDADGRTWSTSGPA